MESTMIACTPYDGTQATNDKIYNSKDFKIYS